MVTPPSQKAPDRVPAGRIRLALEDYQELPEDGKRYQILDGELDVTPAPSTLHQAVSKRLLVLLYQQVEEQDLGWVFTAPCDVILDNHTIVQPDLIFVSTERRERIGAQAIQGAPDLVVEIISESTARTDRMRKAGLYARFGVNHYWIVDPVAGTIEEYALSDAGFREVARASIGTVFQPALFPELAFELERLFKPAS